MSDGNASLDPGMTGIIDDSELKTIESIPGYKSKYWSLMGGYDPYIGSTLGWEHRELNIKKKEYLGWYSFLLVPYIGGYAAMW